LQRFVFRKFFAGREFLHEINAGPAKGLIYPISLPLDKAIWTGAYESDLAQAVASSVTKGDVCYDIGAYRGFFSGVFAMAGAGQVVAFEPFPANCEQLERMRAANPRLPLTFERAAVGNEQGTVEFNVMPEFSMGKLASSNFQEEVSGTAVLKVSLKTIDGLILSGKYPAPQVIKIDVEGAEIDVLQGGRKTLEDEKPVLFIEAHSDALRDQCTELLESLGYGVSIFEKEPLASQVCHLVAKPQ
jgi:FkbM family methyltransferase